MMKGLERSPVIMNKLRESLSRLKQIDYAFLFGSAVGSLRPQSDIDILIGEGLTPAERIDLAMELELVLKRKVDIVPIEGASCELIMEAFSKGVPIVINNKNNLKNDYFRSFYLYDDGRNLRELRRLKIKRMYARG